MAERKQVVCPEVPARIPVMSVAMISDSLVFAGGQVGFNHQTKTLVEGGIKARVKKALENLNYVLKSAGTDLNNAVKVNIYLTDMKNFPLVNEVYLDFFTIPRPARTCIAVYQLPLGADVEIECIAAIPKKASKL